MIAPEVVDFRVAITAPFCAPLPVDEVVIVGAAAGVSVGVGGVVGAFPPPPQPHNKALNKKAAIPIPIPIRIAIDSRSRQFEPGSFRRNHEIIAIRLRQPPAGC